MGNHSENGIAATIRVFAFIMFIAGLIISVLAFSDDSTWILGLLYLMTGFMSGLMMLGFSEIIYLLQDISSKPSRAVSRTTEPMQVQPARTQPTLDEPVQQSGFAWAPGRNDPDAQVILSEPSGRGSFRNGFNKDAFFASISQLDRVSEMYDRVTRVSSANPDLFSRDVIHQLKDCVDIERIYGKGAGKQTFLDKLRDYFSM